ncbi:OprO/OprP family phosphate-selective porin [Candidatus Binatus sp.]|uniref:OprO/OprP family phosphate-selective porin n=1 Tax=Candidatus Binatus sp. TaxID=2811406 RepID=UPI003C862374
MRKISLPILPALLASVIIGVMFAARPAHAQSTPAADPKDQEIQLLKTEINQLEHRVDTLEGLDQKVKVIDRRLEVQQQTVQAEHQKALSMPVVHVGEEGFSLSSPNHDYNLNLSGIIQGDGRFFTSGSDKDVGSTFFLNRVRPILTGSLGQYYNFNITPDFGQGRVTLQDAYINMTYWDYASLRAGKFKAPFDLERLQSDRDLEFSERSEIQNIVPNRDTGASLHGRLLDGRIFYDAALMNGVPDNTAADTTDLDNNDGKDFVGRIFATPFELSETRWLKGLGFGFAGTYGDERGTTTSVYRTYGMSTWFSYNSGVTASGLRARLEPQAYYYWRGLGLMAEYAQDEHSLNLFTTKGSAPFKRLIDRTDTFTDTGYMAQASYILTGEDASYGWVKPYHSFDPRNGFFGAWEVAARISNVAAQTRQFQLGFANPSLSAKTATEFAAGINWYLTPNVKWQFDYANTFFNGGAGTATDVKDRPNESVFESQLQISFGS